MVLFICEPRALERDFVITTGKLVEAAIVAALESGAASLRSASPALLTISVIPPVVST